jgi:phage terminase large subunit
MMTMKNKPVQINISKKVFNKKFIPLLDSQDRYLVLMGGGGSGKSVFASQKIVYRMLSEQGHRFLVLRKVAKTLRESVFMEFKKTIGNWKLNHLFQIPKGVSSELHIKCVNGNEILFAGLDDVEKLKSISGITGIWIEEASEINPEDFRQLDIRLRGKTKNYKQMIISFNPIDINHWLKKEFFDFKKPNATTIHSTYKDNKFLDEENIRVLEAFKETDPYFYQVYALGEWGVLGKTIFSARKVSERIAYLRQQYEKQPLKRGSFVFEYENDRIIEKTIQWVDDPNGYITIYEDVQDKRPYVLGGDTAGEGSDNFTGHVIDNISGKQVAVLKHQFDEHYYARQMYCLAKYYNTSLVGLEVNFSTFPTREFERWNYPKMYVRESVDDFTHKTVKKFGFVTGRVTRPLMIANLVQLVDESIHLIQDIPTLEEMLTFVRNEKGRPEAQEGSHDDLIMGLAITYAIRDQQSYTVDTAQKFDVSKLPKDLQEDYWRAPADMRAYLLKKWGVVK